MAAEGKIGSAQLNRNENVLLSVSVVLRANPPSRNSMRKSATVGSVRASASAAHTADPELDRSVAPPALRTFVRRQSPKTLPPQALNGSFGVGLNSGHCEQSQAFGSGSSQRVTPIRPSPQAQLSSGMHVPPPAPPMPPTPAEPPMLPEPAVPPLGPDRGEPELPELPQLNTAADSAAAAQAHVPRTTQYATRLLPRRSRSDERTQTLSSFSLRLPLLDSVRQPEAIFRQRRAAVAGQSREQLMIDQRSRVRSIRR
jgi:hypothetical protein